LIRTLALSLAAALALPHPAAADPPALPQYEVTIVGGASPGIAGVESFPLGLNLNGRVVGYQYSTGSMQPLNWKDGIPRDMTGPTFDRTFGAAVNNLGRVVGGGYITDSQGAILESHALKWTGGILSDLGTLGGRQAVALAINNANDQVVGYSTLPGDQVTKAFHYANGHMTALETLPGATLSYPYDISDNGYVVGAAVAGSPAKPFRLRNGSVEALSLPTGARTGSANAVNNIGAAVGTYEIDLDAGSYAAVLWRVTGERVDLGNLGGPLPYAVAKDINNAGQVVGTSLAGDGNFSAFLWQRGQLYDLNDFLLPGAPGVRLLSANSINDHGTIAASALLDSGIETTVLLTPIIPGVPTAGTLSVLAAGGVMLGLRRR
jgi:probable HAF family extracellular repeat protein